MTFLDAHTGTWAGSNAFRLMPTDAPHDAPFTATVSLAAGDNLVQIAYSWVHASDGSQTGLIVLGSGAEADEIVAFWGDTWHQHPEPRTLHGMIRDGIVTVGYTYSGEWRWELVLDPSTADELTLTMNNVIPESAASAEMAAGVYAAMHAVLRAG